MSNWTMAPGTRSGASGKKPHVLGGLGFSGSNRKALRMSPYKEAPGIRVILSSTSTGLLFPVEKFRVQVHPLPPMSCKRH